MFEKILTGIPGCFILKFKRLPDNRGWFTKTFHSGILNQLDIRFKCEEEYFSESKKGVFRGLHFQVPPFAIDKLVTCISGSVTDYVVDLRKGSPTYGKWESFELSEEVPQSVFIPAGMAHGFFAQSDKAVIQCKSSGVFDAARDKAISFRSFSFSKNIVDPILSDKDKEAPSLEEFENPFVFAG